MCQYCDDQLIKALPGDDGDIWRPHESPFIRELIEKWTSHGMNKFGALQAEFAKWTNHEFHNPSSKAIQRPGALLRMNPAELSVARFYLESIPPELFTVDDWMMVVDYLVQRYLPHDEMIDEARWQVTRAAMMGRVEAQMPLMSALAAGRVAMALPFDITVIEREFGLYPAQNAAIEFGQARNCQYVTNVTEAVRNKMKLTVIEWQQDKFLGTPSVIAKRDLQGRLLDEFAVLNRDWRRIAMTELADASMNGLLASLPNNSKVKRQEMYRGACPYCQSIDGRIFTLVSPTAKEKNSETQVWVGKTNYGRSSAPSKRTPEGLKPRTAVEMWHVPAGPVHPHCRGRWQPVLNVAPGGDPRFAAWLENHFKQSKPPRE